MLRTYFSRWIVLSLLISLLAPPGGRVRAANAFAWPPSPAEAPASPWLSSDPGEVEEWIALPAWFTDDSVRTCAPGVDKLAGIPGPQASASPSAEPQAFTDRAGRYRFEGLPRGTHKITLDAATLPPDLRPAPEEAVPVLWLNPGQEQTSDALSTGVRFTAAYGRESGTIAGLVFVDQDGDGQPGEGEPGIPGVRVVDPTVHQYFVPFDDRNLWTLFDGKGDCHVAPNFQLPLVSSVFLTAESDETTYYYDHWEDGYDPDPLRPGPTTEMGMLDAGTTQLFQSNIDPASLPWPAPAPPYYYDGRDRITILGESGSVVRLAHPLETLPGSNNGVIAAAAWEVPEVAEWGTRYVAIAGEDLDFNGPFVDDHDYAGLEAMASQDGTVIYHYRDGVLLTTTTLNAGQTFFVPGANDGAGGGGVDSGDLITANHPIQVQMLTGACGTPVSANGYDLQPVDVWDHTYWAPVPGFAEGCNPVPGRDTNADTDVYIHNPHPYPILVAVSSNFTQVDVPVPANTTISVLDATGWLDLSAGNYGAILSSADTFGGLAVIDSSTNGIATGQAFDWGYSLVPASKLSSQVVIGYAPGNNNDPPTDNGNLAFVTAITDTVVYVDLDQDGLSDPFDMDGDGLATSNDVYGVPEWDEPLSALGIPLLAGQVLRAGDPYDRNLRGAIIYTTDLNERIAVAWGQDPCWADTRIPYLDLGYTILPAPIPSLSKVDELAIDADMTGDVSPGDTITYAMVLYNNGRGPMNNVVLTDALPYTYTDYVVSSLRITTPPDVRAIEYYDGASWGTTPTPDAQIMRIAWDAIGPRQTVTIAFRVQLNSSIPPTVTHIANQAVVRSDETPPRESGTKTEIGRPALAIAKNVTPPTVRPGDPVTYTVVVINRGTGLALNLILTDAFPAGITYRPGTLNMTWPRVEQEGTMTRTITRTSNFHGHYADDLDATPTQSTNYAGSDGSLAWSTDWSEVNDDGDPGSGEVQVRTDTTNALSDPAYLEMTNNDDDAAGVQRVADLSQFRAPRLRYYVFGITSGLPGDDQYSVVVNGTTLATLTYNGGWTQLGEIDLSAYAGVAAVTIGFQALANMEATDLYRFDHIAIYEADPLRVLTETLTWEQPTLTYITASGGDPVSYDSISGRMVITQGMRLPAGGILTATYQAQVSIPLTNGLWLTNTACVEASNHWGTLCDDAAIQVQSSHALTLTKIGVPNPVAPGGLLTYTLAYVASGDDPAPNAIITDAIPTGTTFYAATGGLYVEAPPVGSTGVVTWHLGTLLTATSGITYQDGTVTLVVRVDPGLTTGPILNTARIVDDTGTSDEDDETTDLLPPQADLLIAKSDDPDPAIAGGALVYTLVYTNTGPSDAQDVYITDTLPAEVVFGGIVETVPPLSGPAQVGRSLTWYTPTLRAGVTGRIVYTVTVGPDMANTITNSVTITSTTPDPNPGNNRDQEPTEPPTPGLTVVKWATPTAAASGQTITYTLVVTNSGGIPLDSVTLIDTLPAGFTYADRATPAEPDTIAGQTLTWNDISGGAGLIPRESLTVTFQALVTVGAGVTGTNRVTGTGTHPGGTITDTDRYDVPVRNPAIAIEKRAHKVDQDQLAPNYVTFTIAITNIGPSAIDVLPLDDQYDAGYLSFEWAEPMPEEEADDGLLTWYDLTAAGTHGFGRNLLPGEAFVITTIFRVIKDIDTTTNTATVTGAVDVYDTPVEEVEDNEVISNIPTLVELLYFRAMSLPGTVLLEWATAVEIDTYGFSLLRSASSNLQDAAEIAFVPAAGHGLGGGAAYSLKDLDVQAGITYTYWLVDVDTAGRRTIHGAVTITAMSGSGTSHHIYLPLIAP